MTSFETHIFIYPNSSSQFPASDPLDRFKRIFRLWNFITLLSIDLALNPNWRKWGKPYLFCLRESRPAFLLILLLMVQYHNIWSFQKWI